MECKVCGFVRGEEDFIRIFSDHKFKIDNPTECNGYNYCEPQISVELYACPKCMTVLMDA